MPGAVVVGLDAGGTTTRATTLSLDGRRLGTGRAGGGNPTSHGIDTALGEIRTALRAALDGLDPARIQAGAIGLAGAGRVLSDPAGRAALDQTWHEVGLRCPYMVHGDALVAYASGTSAPDGTVLVAGTGAIAAQVHDRRLDRVADGHGWLLGDAGSGFWLGREAVRLLLTDLDTGRTPDPLGRQVLAGVLGTSEVASRRRDTIDALIQAITRRPAVELAQFAPLVITAALANEPAATALLDQAARRLTETTARIRPVGDHTPVVLGGGLLAGDTPLAAAVRSEVSRRWPSAPVYPAGDGAAAAAWLAALGLPDTGDPAALHTRLVLRCPGHPLAGALS
ncbi:N-acetylglucosamine kinase [Salinispora arenicola]|uniref:N-acetylglucosamine kinase n=1 Tax=Salinispora arenicola TaxID=168697 RepID=UPI00169B6AA3|nr:BadF/BadG/BcrA/BcrD ATPase family protein [Salinispora arenicola]NIL63896.1 ATPase [Salinispora arenicola]